jgi:hypothetical protein
MCPEDGGVGTAGLCATCAHCRVITTRRSTFYMCQRSFTDARFPKYPRLPVLRCVGYERGTPSDGTNQPERSTDPG